MIKKINIIFLLIMSTNLYSQKYSEINLLEGFDKDVKKYSKSAFKTLKVCNIQTTKIASKGELYLYLSHRFGNVKDGVETFFGLDNANTKIELAYGLLDLIQVSIGRESLRKTYSSSVKVKFFDQNDNIPLNLGLYSTININSAIDEDIYPKMIFNDRLSYATQLLLSSKLYKGFSLVMAPTYIRQNLVLENFQSHNQYALGMGISIKLSRRISLNSDYSYNFNRSSNSVFFNPLSFGVDIDTGGHVFQILFSNAQSNNEPGFLTNAEGDWSKGKVFFGFNLVRVF